MDPNIHPDQPGLSNSPNAGDGVNYLRRLRGAASGTAPAPKNESDPATAVPPYRQDRRESTRLRCSGSAEFRARGDSAHMWATLTDISLRGCYLEMNNTFPVNTKVDLVLKSCGVCIEVAGSVRTSYPALGMGIGFVNVKPEQQSRINKLLAALGGQSAFFRGAPERQQAAQQPSSPSHPQTLLEEMTDFFRKHPVLSREEFNEMVKRFRRS